MKKIAPKVICFLSAPSRARVYLSCEIACRAQAGAVCVQMLLSCQMALGVISRRHLRGGTSGLDYSSGCSTPQCFGGLSANQRRLNRILSSCIVALQLTRNMAAVEMTEPARPSYLEPPSPIVEPPSPTLSEPGSPTSPRGMNPRGDVGWELLYFDAPTRGEQIRLLFKLAKVSLLALL